MKKTPFIAGIALLFAISALAQQRDPENNKGIVGAGEPEQVFVKGGCFQMGDTFGDGDEAELPVHEVCVSDFSIGKYEVTQGQWIAVMGSNPSEFRKCGLDCPVESVSWNDVQEFIRRLNRTTGKKYRLPTEAEWEYAARSGGKKEKWAGTSAEARVADFAWFGLFQDDRLKRPHPVGKKHPNSLGLHDMGGNVSEWVQDWYEKKAYQNSARQNPTGPKSAVYRTLRGGSWLDDAWGVRATARGGDDPDEKLPVYGFRLAL